MLLDNSNFLFRFLDKINAVVPPFPWFNPVQRSSTVAAIQSFERSHFDTLLVAIIIGNLAKGCQLSHEPFEEITQALNMSSNIWLTLSVCPEV
jgi:hypothetical protein